MKPLHVIGSLLPLTIVNLSLLLLGGFFANQAITREYLYGTEPISSRVIAVFLIVLLFLMSVFSITTTERAMALKTVLSYFFSFATPVFLSALFLMYLFSITPFGKDMVGTIGSSGETSAIIVLLFNHLVGLGLVFLGYAVFLLATRTYNILFFTPGLYIVALFFTPLIAFPNLMFFPIYVANDLLIGRL